ncbi:uncharacterized protein LOC124293733 [Neodiprion lecontei]|uniref:Uncharacterized protein LOC124293732 n=1 Tax=Neodiprion lecontei TaxID=441921 RepID=A0ABM3FV22_NEOLC|nr:uncharacterized protein LOC124293732 [Neodiprion lecontei]XP_046591847.1 uncharacterized protein LOC124293733 [Neodiprion lecontei]
MCSNTENIYYYSRYNPRWSSVVVGGGWLWPEVDEMEDQEDKENKVVEDDEDSSTSVGTLRLSTGLGLPLRRLCYSEGECSQHLVEIGNSVMFYDKFSTLPLDYLTEQFTDVTSEPMRATVFIFFIR